MAKLLDSYQGPSGAVLEVYDDGTVFIATEQGFTLFLSLDDFESFVAWWVSRSPLKVRQ